MGGTAGGATVCMWQDYSEHAVQHSLVEEHGQHHLIGLLGEVTEEQDVVRRVVWNLRREREPYQRLVAARR